MGKSPRKGCGSRNGEAAREDETRGGEANLHGNAQSVKVGSQQLTTGSAEQVATLASFDARVDFVIAMCVVDVQLRWLVRKSLGGGVPRVGEMTSYRSFLSPRHWRHWPTYNFYVRAPNQSWTVQ